MSFKQSNGMPFVLHGYPIRTRYYYLDTAVISSVWASHMVQFQFLHYLRIIGAFILGFQMFVFFCGICS
jgi:hypothetical protein